MFKTILKKAWQITWHHPILWIFGFFTAFLFSNEANILIQNFQTLNRLFSRFYTWQITGSSISAWTNFKAFFGDVSLINFSIFAVAAFLFVCLAVFAQIALIKAVNKLRTRALLPLLSPEKKITFKECLQINRRHFGLVLIFNIINLLSVYFIFFLLGYPLILIFLKSGQKIYLALFFILSLIIFLVFSIIISFLVRFAIFYVVIHNNNFITALRKALALFRKHWLKSLYFALVIFIISLLTGLFLLAIIATSAVPLILLNTVFLQFKVLLGYWLILGLGLIIFSLLTIVFGSLFSTFQTVAWLLFFTESLPSKSL